MNIDDIEKNDDYQNNEKEIKKIENDMMILSQTMTDLHDLIHEQSESIDTLEDFISESKNDIKQGETQLVIADNINRDYSYISGVISIGAIGIMIGFVLF